MPLTTRRRRPGTRIAVPAGKPRSRVAQAVANSLATMSGRRRRAAKRARARFEGLDIDQRVREIGEW